MTEYLRSTPLLDFESAPIAGLVADRRWHDLDVEHRIGAIYDFVRDEIPFGYNECDRIQASRVLADGYGQCNTKTILIMALLRAVDVPCRMQGSTIHKSLQKGVVTGLAYRVAPRHIAHTWAEVLLDQRWVQLEGVICDSKYLDGVRARFPLVDGEFSGYAIGTECLIQPPIEWCGCDTAIQATGIDQKFGAFSDPDEFFAVHPDLVLSGLRDWIFRKVVRPRMNRTVAAIRAHAPATS